MSTDQEGFISIFGFGNNTRFKAIPDELFFGSDYTPEDEIVTNNETRNRLCILLSGGLVRIEFFFFSIFALN